MRRSGAAGIMGPSSTSLSLATHTLLATPTPPELTFSRSTSPKSKKLALHHHNLQYAPSPALFTHSAASQGDIIRQGNPVETHGLLNVSVNEHDDDNEDERAAAAIHHHFFRLLKSRTRSVAENEDLQDWLLQTYNAAYMTLLSLSHGNARCFRDLIFSMSVLSRTATDYVVRQDETPTGSVFIVMSGQCTEIIRRHRFNIANAASFSAQTALPRQPASDVAATDATSSNGDDLTWRTLRSGDVFGLESIYFQFPHHYISLRADGCVERNRIGVSTLHPTHLLVLPAYPRDKVALCSSISTTSARSSTGAMSPTSGMLSVASTASRVGSTFLEQVFLLRSLPHASIEFLASHLTILHVTKNEYLYTAGQPPSIYFVLSGELCVYTVEDVVITTDGESEVVTRRVELQILKAYDCTGLAEVCLNQTGFHNYCVAAVDASVYILPTYALFAVVKGGMPVLDVFVQYFTRQRTWYKLRRFTALNHYNKRVDYRLTPGMQRKGPIPCPRCGLPGHMSDSLVCKQNAHGDTVDVDPRTLTSTAAADAVSPRRPPSVRNAFLHRRMTASERDVMLDESGLQSELDVADGAGSIEKALRRMDRALGLLVPSKTFHIRRKSKAKVDAPILTNSPSTPKTLPTMITRSRPKLPAG
ncbi:hypothetical protein H310_11555 [Aphanomyces invadans]|uniref:Cyclic nucleotide-binding domain-containing protein n=1 Tax=Aphanomyces invadans TaxID=157072 RepID=A0A024TMT5_9STRA|nr:hypothetical protein H310_11555 [Aphanomyces invadans]ETV94906.1 hypothetical protein H310_11555 [Aphanomyces invadans]|eukprot:XP_008876497.1 hypothetical protein H310_11555 [Aphanomyces invadans]